MTTLVWFTKYWPRCRCPPAPPCRSWPRSRSWWWACSGRSAGGWAPSWPGWPWWWGQGSGSDPLTLETGHWLCVQLAPALTPVGRKAPGFTDSAAAAVEEEPIVCGWVSVILITLTHCRLLPPLLRKWTICFDTGWAGYAAWGVWNMQTVRAWERASALRVESKLFILTRTYSSCSESINKTPLYVTCNTRQNVNIYFFSNKWS